MKNIEKHFNELKDILEGSSSMHCPIHHFRTGNSDCPSLACEDCFIESLAWLNEECIEPIKLTKFEYHLLGTCGGHVIFSNHHTVTKMRELGYYKGVPDTSMTIKEILENFGVTKDET